MAETQPLCGKALLRLFSWVQYPDPWVGFKSLVLAFVFESPARPQGVEVRP